MAETIKSTACAAAAPAFPGVTCVLQRRHRGEHRGVAWIAGTPSDHYWTTTSHKGRVGYADPGPVDGKRVRA